MNSSKKAIRVRKKRHRRSHALGFSFLVALVSGALLVSPGTSSADHLGDSGRDPDDVRGRLDIAYVAARPIKEGRRILFVIKTRENWGCRYFQGTSLTDAERLRGGLRWEVDTNNDPYFEHTFFYGCESNKHFYLSVNEHLYRATKPSGRRIRASVPTSKAGLDKEQLEVIPISRSDGFNGEDVLVDEEDVAPSLKPYTPLG